eukprot:749003-Hanusia_phi.AAC.3
MSITLPCPIRQTLFLSSITVATAHPYPHVPNAVPTPSSGRWASGLGSDTTDLAGGEAALRIQEPLTAGQCPPPGPGGKDHSGYLSTP